ncbi:MAG: hypothetical protein R3230_01570 [Nitrosopumilaceae archaeon]|nr:hypothetical protein [Nitrosopumilaceae archaeon]
MNTQKKTKRAPKNPRKPRLRQEIRARKELKNIVRDFPHTRKEQDEIALSLFNYLIKNPQECSLDGFCIHVKLPMTDLKQIAEKNSLFAKVIDLAHHLIAQRLYKGWQDKSLDKDFATSLLRIYSQEFRDMKNERYLLAQKAVATSMGGPIQVVELENFVIEKDTVADAQA